MDPVELAFDGLEFDEHTFVDIAADSGNEILNALIEHVKIVVVRNRPLPTVFVDSCQKLVEGPQRTEAIRQDRKPLTEFVNVSSVHMLVRYTAPRYPTTRGEGDAGTGGGGKNGD